METAGTWYSASLPVEYNSLYNTHIAVVCAFGKTIFVRTRNTKRSAAWNVSMSSI